MPKTTAIDISCQRFGKLTALRTERSRKDGKRLWVCVCDCGNETEACASELKSGHKRSCGCLFSERVQNKQWKHGGCSDSEYRIWWDMKKRCDSPGASSHRFYGGRGISVCDRWCGSYANFLADMGRRPSPKHTLDRINNDGNYEPGNCRWATWGEQARNKRNNVFIEFEGRRMIVKDWAAKLGITSSSLTQRIRRHGIASAMKMTRLGGCQV